MGFLWYGGNMTYRDKNPAASNNWTSKQQNYYNQRASQIGTAGPDYGGWLGSAGLGAAMGFATGGPLGAFIGGGGGLLAAILNNNEENDEKTRRLDALSSEVSLMPAERMNPYGFNTSGYRARLDKAMGQVDSQFKGGEERLLANNARLGGGNLSALQNLYHSEKAAARADANRSVDLFEDQQKNAWDTDETKRMDDNYWKTQDNNYRWDSFYYGKEKDRAESYGNTAQSLVGLYGLYKNKRTPQTTTEIRNEERPGVYRRSFNADYSPDHPLAFR